MRIEQHIVAAWAGRIRDKIIEDAVAGLERMTGSGGEMLSGDSGLKTVWEEICVQVQGEESFFWNTYVETMEGVLGGYVELLDRDSQLALWTDTNEGWDYVYDHRDENAGVDDVPLSTQDIVAKLIEVLLSEAADFENRRIEKHLARHEDGYDELEDEDEIEEEAQDDEDPFVKTEPDTAGAVAGKPVFDLRPGVTEPILFVISRQQVEDLDIDGPFDFLISLMPADPPDSPEAVWARKGRVSLIIAGYDSDPRELFEIPEVCRYLKALDDLWSFWFFFFSQADESLVVLAMCLASAIEVEPGKAYVDPEGMRRFLERGFSGIKHVFDTYGFPPGENLALSTEILRMFSAGADLERE